MKYAYTETRKLSMYDLRALCIRKNWMDRSTNEVYSDFLENAHGIQNVTTDDLADIANCIMEHSSDMVDTHEVTDVMWELAKACTVTFAEV